MESACFTGTVIVIVLLSCVCYNRRHVVSTANHRHQHPPKPSAKAIGGSAFSKPLFKDLIYGICVKVTDGDGLIVRTVNNIKLRIRIAGVDAPESNYFNHGLQPQPFSHEAKEFLTELMLNKTVCLHVLRVDQYDRIVASVKIIRPSSFFWNASRIIQQDVGLEMLQSGLAVIYEGWGAEYDGLFDVYQLVQSGARQSKIGIWSLGPNFETPADFKDRIRRMQH
ncbi:hypothetical protein SeMB42_g01762 [Synchytrium endobioticum]|uniref:TNase-like domain-containing protein n=1 Tax=Synchytrium endobioticum TaxID=286115 RepID=A0A507DJW3_9FUNG|nr:hypothetical protein SeLEV6574_g02195 [Synchytrium endobioticum]TPX51934.1 hypothetical protein SeMB42_g01762 [Synchytrium endobioticum]